MSTFLQDNNMIWIEIFWQLNQKKWKTYIFLFQVELMLSDGGLPNTLGQFWRGALEGLKENLSGWPSR